MEAARHCFERLDVGQALIDDHVKNFASQLAEELHKEFPDRKEIIALVGVIHALDSVSFMLEDDDECDAPAQAEVA